MQTLEHLALLNFLSLLAAGFLLFILFYWIRFLTKHPRGAIGTAKPTPRDTQGKGYLASAYAYDESYSPGANCGNLGPLPVRKKRQRKTPTTFSKYEE